MFNVRTLTTRYTPYNDDFSYQTDVVSSLTDKDYAAIDNYLKSVGLERKDHVKVETIENSSPGYLVNAFAFEVTDSSLTTSKAADVISTVIDNFIDGIEGIVDSFITNGMVLSYTFSDDENHVFYHVVVLTADM